MSEKKETFMLTNSLPLSLSLPLSPRANLSQDYFTDRQDRYILFSDSRNLADYFSELAKTVAAHSHRVLPDMSTGPPEIGFDPLSSTANSQKYIKLMSENVGKLLVNDHPENYSACAVSSDVDADTAVFPLIQMGQYGIRQEEVVTTALMEGVQKNERLCLASGYFNLPSKYISALLQAEGDISVLAASPQVIYRHVGRCTSVHSRRP